MIERNIPLRLADTRVSTVPQTVQHNVRSYSNSLERTIITLGLMKDRVLPYLNDPIITNIAWSLQKGDVFDTLLNDFAYIKKNIPYVEDDPNYEEVIRSPYQTLVQHTGGDCDDMSVAAAAICRIQGFSVIFRAVQWRLKGQFTHVYCVVDGINFDLVQNQLGKIYRQKPGVPFVTYDVQV